MRRLLLVCLLALLAARSPTTTAVNSAAGRLGCYQDSGDRVWKQWRNVHEKNSARFCKNMCQEFKFAGLQDGPQCMCGDELPPTKLADSRCNTPCPSEPGQTCGGGWALEVFAVERRPGMLGAPVGCFQDSAERVWKSGKLVLQNLTPQRCLDTCRGFRYAGMQDGQECFCGNTLPPTRLDKSSCQTQCNALAGKTCGGPWALEVFELSEAQAPLQVVGCVPLGYQARDDLGTYKLYTQRLAWDEAWQRCEDDDAHLLIINSEDEAEFVRSLFAHVPSETRMHAGFHDLLRKGTYRTLFGTALSTTGYTLWSAQHPQLPSPTKHCGAVDAQAHLVQIDGNCAAQALFACEKKADSPDAQGSAQQIDVRGAFAAI